MGTLESVARVAWGTLNLQLAAGTATVGHLAGLCPSPMASEATLEWSASEVGHSAPVCVGTPSLTTDAPNAWNCASWPQLNCCAQAPGPTSVPLLNLFLLPEWPPTLQTTVLFQPFSPALSWVCALGNTRPGTWKVKKADPSASAVGSTDAWSGPCGPPPAPTRSFSGPYLALYFQSLLGFWGPQ